MYSVTGSPLSVPRTGNVAPVASTMRVSALALMGWTKTPASENALMFESEMRTAIAALSWSSGDAPDGPNGLPYPDLIPTQLPNGGGGVVVAGTSTIPPPWISIRVI